MDLETQVATSGPLWLDPIVTDDQDARIENAVREILSNVGEDPSIKDR